MKVYLIQWQDEVTGISGQRWATSRVSAEDLIAALDGSHRDVTATFTRIEIPQTRKDLVAYLNTIGGDKVVQ